MNNDVMVWELVGRECGKTNNKMSKHLRNEKDFIVVQ